MKKKNAASQHLTSIIVFPAMVQLVTGSLYCEEEEGLQGRCKSHPLPEV